MRLIRDQSLLNSLKNGAAETAVRFSDWEESVADIEVYFGSLASSSSACLPLHIPSRLSARCELALDVTYSRHSDDCIANRARWATFADCLAVQLDAVDSLSLVVLTGWALDLGRKLEVEKIVVPKALNKDAVAEPGGVRYDVLRAHGFTESCQSGFTVAAMVPGNIHQAGSLPAMFEVLRSKDIYVTAIDAYGDIYQLPYAGQAMKEEEFVGIGGWTEAVSALRCYTVSVEIDTTRWDTRHIGNYAVIFCVMCSARPKHIVIAKVETAGKLVYPAIDLEEYPGVEGTYFLRIDTIGVWDGTSHYEFRLFCDADVIIYCPSGAPGAFR